MKPRRFLPNNDFNGSMVNPNFLNFRKCINKCIYSCTGITKMTHLQLTVLMLHSKHDTFYSKHYVQ